MVGWLQLQLREGQLQNGEELLSNRFWGEMMQSQMFLPESEVPITKPYFPVTDEHTASGLGWTLGTYRGSFRLILHA
jgi:hypothetical protein